MVAGALIGGAAGLLAWLMSGWWITRWSAAVTGDSKRMSIAAALTGAGLGLLGAVRHGGDAASSMSLGLCGPFLLFLLATDARVRRVPVAGAALLAVAGLAAATFGGPERQMLAFAGALAGFLAAGALWTVGKVLARRGEVAFGPGDVLMAVGIGLAVGWPTVLLVLFWGAVAAAVVAVGVILIGKSREPLPWGAFICGAALIALAI
ncbi:MAG: prepilin peptidase [Thermomicrobiales bacterium]